MSVQTSQELMTADVLDFSKNKVPFFQRVDYVARLAGVEQRGGAMLRDQHCGPRCQGSGASTRAVDGRGAGQQRRYARTLRAAHDRQVGDLITYI